MTKQTAAVTATDDDGINEAALDYIRRFGSNAVSYLDELADIDADRGDHLSADTWRSIASAAEQIARVKSAA